jgi:hypothetical protein
LTKEWKKLYTGNGEPQVVIEKDRPEKTEGDYAIIKEAKLRTDKASLDIRLRKEVDKRVLAKIANELRNDGRRKFERIFINFYLPDMKPGEGAWATTHFNPNLEVNILGMTSVEKETLLSNTAKSSMDIIGRWIDNSPYVGGIYSISKSKDGYKLIVNFKDGSKMTKNLVLKQSEGGRTFYESGNNKEFYQIVGNGSLKLFDEDGMIKELNTVKD